MVVNPSTVKLYSRRPSGRRRLIVWLVLLLLVGGSAYATYYFREWIFFRFENDQQGEILRRLAESVEVVRSKATGQEVATEIAKDKTLTEFFALLDSMKNVESLMGVVQFARGKVLFELFAIVPARNRSLYYDIFFLEFVERYAMPKQLDAVAWQQAILSLRKAMALNLPDELKKEAARLLAELYLWGGRPFWTSAYELLEQHSPGKEETIRHLFNIMLARNTPDFEKLTAIFSEEPVLLWQAIYYLKAGNTPLAYSILYKLADAGEEAQIRNNALYLLGRIQGKEKRHRQQIYYYRRIDAVEFLPRAPWFLDEFAYVLRFVGDSGESQRFIAQYEKIVLEQRTQPGQ